MKTKETLLGRTINNILKEKTKQFKIVLMNQVYNYYKQMKKFKSIDSLNINQYFNMI